MNLNELLDVLEDLLVKASNMPFSDKALIPRDRALDVLDEIRAALPRELHEAKMLLKEQDQLMKQASEKANAMMMEAQEQLRNKAEETEIVALAREQAQRILKEAHKTVLEVRQGADEYADNILKNLEINLSKVLKTVEKGREQLHAVQESTRKEA